MKVDAWDIDRSSCAVTSAFWTLTSRAEPLMKMSPDAKFEARPIGGGVTAGPAEMAVPLITADGLFDGAPSYWVSALPWTMLTRSMPALARMVASGAPALYAASL